MAIFNSPLMHNHTLSKHLFSVKGVGFGLALTSGISMMTAPRHHVVSDVAGNFVGPALATLAGDMVAGPVGALAAPFLLGSWNRTIGQGVQAVTNFGLQIGAVGMGGAPNPAYYTPGATTMRATAARELSASLFNARQHLGREAILMHE